MVSPRILLAVLLLALVGCQSAEPRSAAETPSPLATARELALQGQNSLQQDEHEDAALKLRDALTQLSAAGAEAAEIQQVEDSCVLALKEAGGFSSSRRLWLGVAKRNPDSQSQAKRMVARAERMMTSQSAELLQVAKEDFAEGKQAVAKCTARAALELLTEIGAPQVQIQEAGKVLDSFGEKQN